MSPSFSTSKRSRVNDNLLIFFNLSTTVKNPPGLTGRDSGGRVTFLAPNGWGIRRIHAVIVCKNDNYTPSEHIVAAFRSGCEVKRLTLLPVTQNQ